MRVGFDAQLLGNRGFGVERVIESLLGAVAEHAGDNEVVVYANSRFEKLDVPSSQGMSGIRHTVSPAWNKNRLTRIFWVQFCLPRQARKDEIDLLHAPGYIAPILSGLPTVVTVHDILALTAPEFCKWANRCHYRVLLPRSLQVARRILVTSSIVRSILVDRYPNCSEKIVVIPPGVDRCFRTPIGAEREENVRTRFNLQQDFLLFPSRIEPKKNFANILEAYRLLKQRGSFSAELIVTGGSGWGAQNKLREPGVRNLGYLSREDLAAVFRLAKLLVFPSLEEGFGLPVIEAMASGLPVVCSLIPSVVDSDPSAVVVVDPKSPEGIADGIERAWHDQDLRATLVERGLHASAAFSWATTARKTWNVYQQVVSEQTTDSRS